MQENAFDWQKKQKENRSEFPFLDIDDEDEQEINELQENEDSTFVVFSDIHEIPLRTSEEEFEDNMTGMQSDYGSYEEEEDRKTDLSASKNNSKREYDSVNSNRNQFSSEDDFEEFDDIDTNLDDEEGFESEQTIYRGDRGLSNQQANPNKSFLEELDVFDDNNLNSFSDFDAVNSREQSADADLFDRQVEFQEAKSLATTPQGMLSSNQAGELVPANYPGSPETPLVESPSEIEQGVLGAYKNSSLTEKQWIAAGAAGILSAIAVAVVGLAASGQSEQKQEISQVWKVGVLMTVASGAVSFGTSMFFGALSTNQVKRSAFDLQKQFELLNQGNYNAKATVYSKDEFGQLAAKFNQMAQTISTTTEEAQRRAQETEQAKEDLQRQVIRLLDDVEGAARGDLTVQAEVTADVLGAVADAFNLTIQNLREIVKQVKLAAQQVNKGATDSESFARNQYNNALAMAGELAVTLNSVQMMTDSIQRVAENAREAEEVARSSAVTALKGGESVERTVAGILEIRETVSETARKVKRLAEASQEISKIVAIIGQISSRTNLLALNASIEAARAGESGRGFAIVADEVRQLADKSAKSLKEIEQIVWQIQTETGSVMEAMEEGLQQVLDVTERAEQAKGSLEDIIQVSNRIDALVRSITASTVEQRENSRAVSEVMQSVELTAQATSRESQRVAGALQNLVSISQELLSSVERFRVDPNEEM